MSRPLVLACVMLVSASEAAAGGKTTKVTIETDPPGAKVYFNLKEDGEVCTTPCTIDAPVGETPIIVEAENRRSIIENLVIPRKSARPIKVSYKLELAVGSLRIEGAAGATITIDDEERGTAPGRFESLQAGPHHVVLERNGKRIYEGFVEIEVGVEASVLGPSDAAPPTPEVAVVTAARPAVPTVRKPPGVTFTAALTAGFRQFRYKGNQTPRLQRDENESGQLLGGPIIEVWPSVLLGLGRLRGLSLYGRFELGLNRQTVTIKNAQGSMTETSLTTAWRSFETSLRQRWTIRDSAAVMVSAGYVDDRYEFEGKPEDLAVVPSAVYKAVRIGARGSLLFGPFEPYAVFENRLVLSGGVMDRRYKLGTSVNGVRGALGATAYVGRYLELRLEGSLTVYTWTFRPDNADLTAPQAEGGSDFIQTVLVSVGYAYP